MRKLGPIALVFILAACSSSTSAFVSHMCGEPIVVSVNEIGNSAEPTVTTVAPNADTSVWNYCCDLGYQPDLDISAGGWSTTVAFDDLWASGAPVVIELPAEACAP